MAGTDSSGEVAKGNRRFSISAELVEHLRRYLKTWRPNSLGSFCNEDGLAVGSQSGSEAEGSSLAEEAGNPAVRLPRVSSWQRHPARSNRCAHGGLAQSSVACRSTDHHGLHTRSTADERRTAEALEKILHGPARNEQNERPAEEPLTDM